MEKAELNKETFVTGKLDLNFMKKLMKFCILSIALCGAETWTLRKIVKKKHLESFEIRCWRSMEKISWTDRVRNKDVGCYMESMKKGTSYLQ
jgi:hypothetical protein